MSKPQSKRTKKRAEPPTQPADNDLLSAESVPQVSVLTSGKAALPPEEKTFQPEANAASEALDQKPPQEEMNQENSSETEAEQEASNITPSAGALLKEAREAAGLSIDEVSHFLKLAPRQVHALEQQDFASLPPRAFVRGFMRNYARFLNIDANVVLDVLPPECPQALSPAASSVKLLTRSMPVLPPYGEKVTRPQTWKWLFAVAALAVIAVVFFFWPQIVALFPESEANPAVAEELKTPSVWQEGENVLAITPIIAPLSEAPAPADPLAAPESPTVIAALTGEEVELVLRFTGDSWVEVRDKHDAILYSAIAREGSEKTLRGAAPFSLVLGNSGSVTVMLRGEPVDMGGQSRQGVARLVLE
ncbi:MAG: DUF4115 domain-containing protein [Burkholderiales bacterium]|nr:DUF4115 domain-containing protein [Burkholderiales bacterium]